MWPASGRRSARRERRCRRRRSRGPTLSPKLFYVNQSVDSDLSSLPVSSLLVGFGLGLFVAAQIGPVSLLIVRSVVRGNFRVGLAMAAAVSLVDLMYAALGLAGVGRALDAADGVGTALGFVGAIVIAAIGLRTLWTGFRARLGLETEGEVATPRRAFAAALAATALNPLTIALWTAAFPAAVAGAGR